MSFASTCVLRSRRGAAGRAPRTPVLVKSSLPYLRLAPDAAGQVRPALPVPAGDQLVQAGDMALGQRARRAARPRARRCAATASRIAMGSPASASAGHPAGLCLRPVRRAGRPRRPLRASSTSASARSRAAVLASASATPGPSASSRAGIRRLTRARVNAGSLFCGSSHNSQALGRAGRPGLRAPQAEQRTPVTTGNRRHACQRTRSGAACQAEQDRFGLVVKRVPEHDRHEPARSAAASSAAYRADRAAASGPG